mgnify:CR=1 FL=1
MMNLQDIRLGRLHVLITVNRLLLKEYNLEFDNYRFFASSKSNSFTRSLRAISLFKEEPSKIIERDLIKDLVKLK